MKYHSQVAMIVLTKSDLDHKNQVHFQVCTSTVQKSNYYFIFKATYDYCIVFLPFSCCYWNSPALGSCTVVSFNGTLCSYTKMMGFNETLGIFIYTLRTRSHFHAVTMWSTLRDDILQSSGTCYGSLF